MQLVRLPNELDVWAPNVFETRALYHEIFLGRGYLQHGVTLKDGDTVFDVGANIGLFSIFAASTYRDLTLYLFEPIPVTLDMLRRNVALHARDCRVTLLPHGLAATAGAATFEYDRFGAMAATMYRADTVAAIRPGTTLRAWGIALAHDFAWTGHLSPRAAERIDRAFNTPGLGLLACVVLRVLMAYVDVRRRIFLQRPVCPLRPLSDVIAEHQVEAIDLLKIDVEGSEHEVLRGIAPDDWPKIRQLTIEVHDLNGRAETVATLLRDKGYQVTVAAAGWDVATVLGIVMVYAVREP